MNPSIQTFPNTSSELKGSNWLKCDLHIHTPASHYHNYGDSRQAATWAKFFEDLENLPSEFKVIGINDYLTLEGYKKVKAYKDSGKLSKVACILPVIEFRINKFAGEGKTKRINYHVIFSPETTIDLIQNQFISAISASYTTESGSPDPDWDQIPTHEALIELGQKIKAQSPGNKTLQNETDWEVGFNNFNIDYVKLKDLLHKPQFKDRTITAIGRSEWDAYRWDGGGASEKRTIINEADFIFVSSENVSKFDAAKAKLNTENVNDKLLDCSDAHYFSSSIEKDRIGNCHTWLKIEPTFNGLKQAIFEPEERICLSETHPDKKQPYQIIQRVRFAGGGVYFTDIPIELSSGFNSIIGGKSTGKSLLAGLIVKSCDLEEFNKRKQKVNHLDWVTEKSPLVDFHVEWKDGHSNSLRGNEATRKISYFPQHFLNSQIDDSGAGSRKLNNIIRKVLAQTPAYNESFEKYEQTKHELENDIASDASDYENTLEELQNQKSILSEKGKSEDIQKNLDKLNEELTALKSQYGLSEEELENHRAITATITTFTDQKNELSNDIDTLAKIDQEHLSETLALQEILSPHYDELSEASQLELGEKLGSQTEVFSKQILETVAQLSEIKNQSRTEIDSQIKQQNKLHAPILEKISKSQPLKEKNDLIKTESEKLAEVKVVEERITNLEKELDAIEEKLKGYIQKQIETTKIVKNAISEKPFTEEDEDLGIEIEPKCKSDHIQELLKERIRYQSNPRVKTYINSEDFDDSKFNGYSDRLETILLQARRKNIELKGEHKLSGLVQELLSNAVYINYDLKLGGDSFTIMSPGKRALALLRVLVELDQSQHPIVFDQPEDDLDNRSVYDGLAKYMKKKKKHRQIIVVTHNPNVVVGADSEFVIVANQSGQEANQDNRKFHFEYVFGGLEDSFEEIGNPYVLEKQGIREHVCEILDGGEAAFKKREKLYTQIEKAKRVLPSPEIKAPEGEQLEPKSIER